MSIETGKKVTIGILFILLVFIITFGGAESEEGAIGIQLIIVASVVSILAIALFGCVYYFSRHCTYISANDLIAGQNHTALQKIIKNAHRCPDTVIRNIRREMRKRLLHRLQKM